MIAVDLFAGGGGTSVAVRVAFGVHPIVAVNHDQHAIAQHTANFPETRHFREDVFTVDPLVATAGVRVDLLCASPDCKHFSKAKGGAPRDNGVRGLAWVVVKWARAILPAVIFLENVEEFVGWGPLDGDRLPIASRKGETFRRFVGRLRGLGYSVDWRILDAADFGAPSFRKRLFLVARRDQLPIRWPEPTHGPKRAQPWLTAADDVIDWSIPCRSIFGRRKPLAEATQRRIAEGVRRFVLTSAKPYLRVLTHGQRVRGIDQPLPTITAAHRGEFGLVAPVLINTRNGERKGQAPRCRSVERPLPTVTAQGSQGALVAAFMAKHNGSGERWNAAIGQGIDCPLHTITSRDTKALVAATLGSVEAEGAGVVAAFLLKYYSQGGQWSRADEPLHTIVTKARMGLVTVDVDGESYALVDIGMRMLEPAELLRGMMGSLAANYVTTGTKTQQIARIGNMVSPWPASATLRAQFEHSDGEQLPLAAK
jgi:DNA (cytosine-5)-methyltransferase 1